MKNQTSQYGGYLIFAVLAGRSVKVVKKDVEARIAVIVLLALNFFSSYYLTIDIMWFVAALLDVSAMILISQFTKKAEYCNALVESL